VKGRRMERRMERRTVNYINMLRKKNVFIESKYDDCAL
jgi:hypothetical protein